MIAFALLGVLVLVAAVAVVGTRNPVYSALWLALNFVGIAGVFALLGAEFLAVVQLVIYAGAILVFFLFVIMLLNLGKLPPGDPRLIQRWGGLYLAILIGVILVFAIHTTAKLLGGTPSATTAGNTSAVAAVLYTDYLFAFELTSVLLTAAVVGAVVLARRKGEA